MGDTPITTEKLREYIMLAVILFLIFFILIKLITKGFTGSPLG